MLPLENIQLLFAYLEDPQYLLFYHFYSLYYQPSYISQLLI